MLDPHLDDGLSNPLCIFLVDFLGNDADDMIHSTSTLPLFKLFVHINPANEFLYSWSIFKRCKQLSIKSGEEASVGPAEAGDGGFDSDGELNGRIQTVCLGCRRAFLGRQGSGKAPLEDQRHSQQHPEGNNIQCSGRKTRPEQSKKHKKMLLKISPPGTAISPRNPTLNLSEIHSLHKTVRILHLVCEIPNRSSWEGTMMAGAACESHRNKSCTINVVTGNKKKKSDF